MRLAVPWHVNELLEHNGGTDAAPVTTDRPLPETSDLVAGWFMVEVNFYERAVELAACVSAQPRPSESLVERLDHRRATDPEQRPGAP